MKQVVDTSRVFPHSSNLYNPYFNGPTKGYELKDLARKHLNREIQKQEGVGQDSTEGALTVLDLMKIESV